jgi:hypothetical protein
VIFRLLFLALFACVSNVSYASDIQIQILNAQIEQLTTERDAKRSALDECLEKKKKMTVAGSVTLATTAIGVGVNIALASKLASADSGGVSASGSGMPADTRSQEQKNCDSCAMFKKKNISPMPGECSGC